MVVIDTSIIIDHTRQKGKISIFDKFIRQSKAKPAIALITVQELFAGQSTKQDETLDYLLDLLNSLEILPYTFEVAKLAGEIARDVNQPIGLADSAIAATAIINQAQFLTLNIKDFAKIEDLKFASV